MSRFSTFVIMVLVLTLSVALLGSHKGKAQQQPIEPRPFQDRERAIMKKTDFNPPVRIRAVKTKGRSVPLSKRFVDDDDWLKGFTVLVHNASSKTINHIEIEMLFRPEGGSKQLPAGWFLSYGYNPFHYKNQDAIPTAAVANVLPGSEIELELSDAEFEDLKTGLSKAGFPEKIHVVEIRVNTIGFTDGTAWITGKMLKRDPGSPVGWTYIDTSTGSLRQPQSPQVSAPNGTANFFLTPINFLDGPQPPNLLTTGTRGVLKREQEPCDNFVGIRKNCATHQPGPGDGDCAYPDLQSFFNPNPNERSEFFQTFCRRIVGSNSNGPLCGGPVFSVRSTVCQIPCGGAGDTCLAHPDCCAGFCNGGQCGEPPPGCVDYICPARSCPMAWIRAHASAILKVP